MKTNYTVNTMLGSQINTNSLESAMKNFDLMPNATNVIDNNAKTILRSRDHKRVGFISSGIRFMGNLKVYKCSDNGKLTTNLGCSKYSEMERISKIDKNRTGETKYFKN